MTVKLFTMSLIASSVLAQASDLASVIVLSTPGLTYPTEFLGYSANEPTDRANWLSPLGQRQQYLIGTEFRNRYILDSPLMSEDYYYYSSYIQTPQVYAHIQSA